MAIKTVGMCTNDCFQMVYQLVTTAFRKVDEDY